MANLPELNEFTTGVYQIETADPVLGGVDGVTNVPLKALANRTKWLKAQVDALNTEIESAIDAGYVQAELNKLPFKAPVVAVTTTNITLSGLKTIDGISVTAGQRVLVAAQSTGAQNGIYTAQVSSWVRADDMNADTEIQAGVQVMVTGGSIFADTIWHLLTDGTITIGSTPQTWKCLTNNTALLGNPTAQTAAQFDSSTKLANTEFVGRAIFDASANLFQKSDSTKAAFAKTGTGTATTSQALIVPVGGGIKFIPSGTAITMPALIAGVDYAIWAKPDGSLEATSNHTSPPVANARKIGGFHYAPGGNATAQSGGNTTPQINEFSFWDLKWRPGCSDPRGMTLVAGSFWADIYMLGVDHQINGSSKFSVTIADGSSPPKVPSKFGGNGSTAYGSLNWWEAAEVGQSFGKRLPAYDEFAALAYGTTENSSIGSDPGSTSWASAYVSKWGVNQATGVLWTWGAEFSYRQDGGSTPWSWRNNTNGRGQLYLYSDVALVASIFGGYWVNAASSGSRASDWASYPWHSSGSLSARFVCDHLSLD